MANTISGIFGRDNRNYQPEAEPDQGLKAYGQSLDLKSAATGKSVLENYDVKSNPDETIAKLKEEFHAATDSLESYLVNEEDVPFFKRKLPNIEFNVEAKEATVKLMNALNADYDSRGKNSYLLTDDGKDLMKKLVSYLPLKSETDDDELKQAQNSSFALLSRQLANTKSSGRLDTISKDLVLRMQAPVYARDDQRRYNLALTLMRNLGPKEFAKPAEKNGEFINVYKRIQDAFAIGGDKAIGKEFARNIHEIISPLLEGPIDHDLEKNLGESAVNAIKEMRKQVWANAEDLMLSSANISKLTPKTINYTGVGADGKGETKTEQLRDHGVVLKDLVAAIKDLYIDNKFEASEQLELIIRDLAYEAHEYGMKAADAKALKKNLQSAITGETGKMTPVPVPVNSLSSEQKEKALSDMLLHSATRVKTALDIKTNLGDASGSLREDYSVAVVKLQSEIAKKMATLSSETVMGKFNIAGESISLTKAELKAVSDAIDPNRLVKSTDVEALITKQGTEGDDRVDAKKSLLKALLNEDRMGQIRAADTVITAESKAFDGLVQKISVYEKEGEAEKGIVGIKALAESLDSYKIDDKLNLQQLADAGRNANEQKIDAGKALLESGNTEVAFQLVNDSKGKKLGTELLKVVQADFNKYNALHQKATKEADTVINTVVLSLNRSGLSSVAHRLVDTFHEFITGGDPESGEINSNKMRDILANDGGLGSVAQKMADYIGSKQTAQDTQLAMLKNEQAERLASHASTVSFGKTAGMDDTAILDHITGQSDASVNKEEAIAKFLDFAKNLYEKTKDKGAANSAFNISDEDIRRLLVVDKGDNLAIAERDIHLKKTMLTVLNALNNDRSNAPDVVIAKERLVNNGVIAFTGTAEINKFSKEAEKIDNTFESKIGELEFSTVGKTKFDSFDQLLEAEQNNDGSGSHGLRSDAHDFLKRMVKVFTGLFMGNKSEAILAYKLGVVDKLKHDTSNGAFNNGLHAAFQE